MHMYLCECGKEISESEYTHFPFKCMDCFKKDKLTVKREFRGEDLDKVTRERLIEIIVYLEHNYRNACRQLVQPKSERTVYE